MYIYRDRERCNYTHLISEYHQYNNDNDNDSHNHDNNSNDNDNNDNNHTNDDNDIIITWGLMVHAGGRSSTRCAL